MSRFVADFYNKNAEMELGRLQTSFSRIEFTSSLFLIDKYFPEQGKILDIGSGSGQYALELLNRDLRVTLFDLPADLLRLARTNIEKQGLTADEYIQGDVILSLKNGGSSTTH